MVNPLNRTPSTVSKKELWTPLISITVLLIFIAVVVSVSLYRSGPPTKEIYKFPQNTYVCTINNNGDEKEKICAFVGKSDVADLNNTEGQ